MKEKINELRAIVIFERISGYQSKYLSIPELTEEERKEIIEECNSSIKKFQSLKLGDLSVYDNTVNEYQRILELVGEKND